METYREHILSSLGWDVMPFEAIPELQASPRLDMVYRFITLIFMEQAGEANLTQQGDRVFVQRCYHEDDQ